MDNALTAPNKGAAPSWLLAVGAMFAALTLIGLFGFAFVAGTASPLFICNSFQLLAAVFALGVGLSAAFIGGAAVSRGDIGLTGGASVVFSLGGGVATLFLAFFAFSFFKPADCPPRGIAPAVERLQDSLRRIQLAQEANGLSQGLVQAAKENSSDARSCSGHANSALATIGRTGDSLRETSSAVTAAIAILTNPTPRN